jgi:hypothetical protein
MGMDGVVMAAEQLWKPPDPPQLEKAEGTARRMPGRQAVSVIPHGFDYPIVREALTTRSRLALLALPKTMGSAEAEIRPRAEGAGSAVLARHCWRDIVRAHRDRPFTHRDRADTMEFRIQGR